jgi:hypothetical protein
VPTSHLRFLQGATGVAGDLLSDIDQVVRWRDRVNARRPCAPSVRPPDERTDFQPMSRYHDRHATDFADPFPPASSERRCRAPRGRLDLALSVERLAVRLQKLAMRLDPDDPDRAWASGLATDLQAARTARDKAHPRRPLV